jgi:hypothetical protein
VWVVWVVAPWGEWVGWRCKALGAWAGHTRRWTMKWKRVCCREAGPRGSSPASWVQSPPVCVRLASPWEWLGDRLDMRTRR